MTRIFRWWFFLLMGFYLCDILTVMPLPEEYQWYRPQWFLMFVLFCQLRLPNSFNPWYAWFAGLLMDCLVGTRLGEHALIFSVLSYLAAVMRPRFMQRPLWQQIEKVFLFVCLGQILILWFHALAGQNPHTLFYWMGTITSCVMWPLWVMVLQSLTQVFQLISLRSRTI